MKTIRNFSTRLLAIAVLSISAAVLTGCMTAEEQAAADRQTCAGYGYSPGSTAFANCMMLSDQRRKKATADWQAEQDRQWQLKTNPPKQECNTVESVDTSLNGQSYQTKTNSVCVEQ